MSGSDVGVIDEPDIDGFRVGGETVEASAGFELFVDILAGFFRVYLMTMTIGSVIIFLVFLTLYYTGKFPSSYGTKMQYFRTRRAAIGLLLSSVLFPILYLSMWFFTGDQEPGGRGLPADGIFGTSFEERFIGPTPESSGVGMLAAILGDLIQTFQVTLSFLFLAMFVFSAVLYLSLRWPPELERAVRVGRVYRAISAFMFIMLFIPILYATAWVFSGFYTPDESLTRVAPAVDLPYAELFAGPHYHPFIQDLATTSDPLAASLRGVLDLHVTTLAYLGVSALAAGGAVHLILSRIGGLNIDTGRKAFRGGLIITIAILLLPALLTGAAWVATGVPTGGIIGSESPEFGDQCVVFEGGDTEQWEVESGTYQVTTDPWGIRLDGTISRELPQMDHGDRTFTMQTGSFDSEFDIRFYDDGVLVEDHTTAYDSTYAQNINGEFKVEIESNGGILQGVCLGIEPASESQLDAAFADHESPVVLRRGLTLNSTIYNVGEVSTGIGFDARYSVNGTDPYGEHALATETIPIQPLGGGAFSDEIVHMGEMSDERPVGDVLVQVEADPEGEIDERSLLPNTDEMLLEIVYADLVADVEAQRLYNNGTAINRGIENRGTYYSPVTPYQVTITDDDAQGSQINQWDMMASEINATHSADESYDHIFDTPGNYTVELDVNDELFPEDSVDTDSIQFINSDLRANISGVEESSWIGTPTEFEMTVSNAGNDAYPGDTEAVIDVLDYAGTVDSTQTVSLPPLEPGEEYTETVTVQLRTSGMNTIRVDAIDEDFPYGSVATAEIEGVGPDFETTVDAENIPTGEPVSTSITVLSNGTHDTASTTMDAQLLNPDGDVVQDTEVSVPALNTGESYSVDLFEEHVPEDTGEHQVEVLVAGTEETVSDAAEDTFDVLDFETELELQANPVTETNQVELVVTGENVGQLPIDAEQVVELEVTDSGGSVVTTDTATLAALDAGESNTTTTTLRLESPGEHTARAELLAEPETYDTDAFDHSWSDLEADIVADETVIYGTATGVDTTATNVGDLDSDSTSAEVLLYDDFGDIDEVDSVSVDSLSPGDQQEWTHQLHFPEPGTYVAVFNIDDQSAPSNSMASTAELEVYYADLRVSVEPADEPVSAGGSEDVFVTVENAGNDPSDADDIDFELIAPNGDVVLDAESDLDTLGPGEEQTSIFTHTFSERGEYLASGTVDTTAEGTVTNTTSIEVVDADITTSADFAESEIGVPDDGELEFTVSNIGTEVSETYTAEITYSDSFGGEVDAAAVEVPGIQPGDSEDFTDLTSELDETGTYYADVEIVSEGGEVVASSSATVDVVDPEITVDVTAADIPPGDSPDVTAEVSNQGDSTSNSLSLTAEAVQESETVLTDETTIDPLGDGESTTVELFSEALSQEDIYTAEVDVETAIMASDEFAVVDQDLAVDLQAEDIREGESPNVEYTVENIAPSQSDQDELSVELIGPDGEVANTESIDIQPLEEGEMQSGDLFAQEYDELGTYEVEASLDSSETTTPDSTATFELGYWDLSAAINATDTNRGSTHTFFVDISNEGNALSDESTVDVIVEDADGADIYTETLDVASIDSGDTLNLPIEFTAERAGEHTIAVDVSDEDRPDGTTAEATIDVTWPDFDVGIEAPEEVEGSDIPLEITVTNQGTAMNDETEGIIYILGQYGMVHDEFVIDLPEVPSGESYEAEHHHTVEMPGTYQAQFHVEDVADGDSDMSDKVEVIHGNLETSVFFQEPAVEVGSEAGFVVDVTNSGNDVADPASVDVVVVNDAGQTILSETVETSELEVGDLERFTFTPTLTEGGVHTGSADVDYPEFPVGTTDQDTVESLTPDLRASITASDAVMEDHTEVEITVENYGTVPSDSTIVEVRMYNADGQRVVLDEFGVGELSYQEVETISFSQLIAPDCWRTEMSCEPGASMNTGEYTAVADVETEYSPAGSEDEDTFTVSE